MPPTIEIQHLLLRIAEKDSRALADLYDATALYVFGLLRRMLWRPESAERVAEEVYGEVWLTARSFDPERGSAWSWLALLARGRAIDRIRADGSSRDAVAELTRRPGPDPARGDESSPAIRPPASSRAGQVRAALAELPGEQRRPLELAFFGGLRQSEVADRVGAPIETVKARIRNAVLGLRDRLAESAGP